MKKTKKEYPMSRWDQCIRWSIRILLIPPIVCINVLQYFALSLVFTIVPTDTQYHIFPEFLYGINWSFWALYPVMTIFDLSCILFLWGITTPRMMSGSSYPTFSFGWRNNIVPWIFIG